MSNVGNIDLERGTGSVTLRMRHVVQGHPGAVLADAEVRTLIGKLEAMLAQRPAVAEPEPDLPENPSFEDDWDIA
jgi:hypothetical protein